jgi:probable rRNA maturation factor
MTRAARSALTIDVLVDSSRWQDAEQVKSIVRRAVTRAASATRSTKATEIAIVLTDDSAIRVLNRTWRGIDAATNVLSFPTRHGQHIGDIVLAYETIAREARGARKPLVHHVAHLAVHGFLHLVGYDHDLDGDAVAMESAERDILRRLAIPDPYRPAASDRAAGHRTQQPAKQPAARRRKT